MANSITFTPDKDKMVTFRLDIGCIARLQSTQDNFLVDCVNVDADLYEHYPTEVLVSGASLLAYYKSVQQLIFERYAPLQNLCGESPSMFKHLVLTHRAKSMLEPYHDTSTSTPLYHDLVSVSFFKYARAVTIVDNNRPINV